MSRVVLLDEVVYPVSETFKFNDEPVIFLNTSDIYSGKFLHSNLSKPSKLPGQAKKKIQKNDILFSEIRPANKRFAFVNFNNTQQHVVSTKLMVLRAKNGVHPEFAYHWITSPQQLATVQAIAESRSGTFPQITFDTIKKLPLNLPAMPEQIKIANFLDEIDGKIELNRQMNDTLEQMGQALFKHYFIDNPETKTWPEGTLKDIIINFDSKRKPLSSRQRAEIRGEYRYFGATSVMDYVNDYLFDGKYLLLAEDGSVIKADGTPYLQYVWGKFWVNNHAHILQAKSPFTVEYLYLLLSKSNVQSLVNGAVQLKINQQAMNNFRIMLPPDEQVIDFCKAIDPMFEYFRKNEEEIQTLTSIRNSLLPRLIAGKIDL